MKLKTAIIVAVICFLSSSKTSYCDNRLSYDETVALIRDTMSNNTSLYRQESYGYIHFNGCGLEYTVAGKYPVGTTYNIKYSNIDISSLNAQQSKISHDYTAFVVLNFDKYLDYNTGSNALKIRTIVLNASDDQATAKLLGAFLHLKDVCRPEEPGDRRQ